MKKEKLFTPLFTLACFIFSLYTFYPGWMSEDSFSQYLDAKNGIYHDWHPVTLAWWWRILLPISNGPQVILIQNLLAYWIGWYLLTRRCEISSGKLAAFLPVFGLWPGVFFPLGHIWKDIFFTTHVFLSWAIIFSAAEGRRLNWIERITILFSLALAVGAKPNGMVVLPFIAYYWISKENRISGARKWHRFAAVFGLTLIIASIPQAINSTLEIRHRAPTQYIQTHDLLAISVATNQVIFPTYIREKIGDNPTTLRPLYEAASNNRLFYSTEIDSVFTTDENNLRQLRNLWIDSIVDHPAIYLQHRWNVLMSLLRVGEHYAAYVVDPKPEANRAGVPFRPTVVRDALWSSLVSTPWMYYPWVYGFALAGGWIFLLLIRQWQTPATLISLSAFAFLAPHFFIAPASDYRYLHYAILCALIIVALSASAALSKIKITTQKPSNQKHKPK